MEELLARIRAALRRASPEEPTPPFISPELQIDFEQRRVTVRGRSVRLTPKEFELLRHLATNPGKPVSHRRLLQAVWGPDYGNETEYLRVFINQRSEEHTSELQSRLHLVCRLLLEKKKKLGSGR